MEKYAGITYANGLAIGASGIIENINCYDVLNFTSPIHSCDASISKLITGPTLTLFIYSYIHDSVMVTLFVK